MYYLGGSGNNLTTGNYYAIESRKGSQVMVYDDNDQECWLSEDFFKEF